MSEDSNNEWLRRALFAAEQFGCDAACNGGPRVINNTTLEDIAAYAQCDFDDLVSMREMIQSHYNDGYRREKSYHFG